MALALQGGVLNGRLRHGEGMQRLPDGSCYQGQWRHDQRSGRGWLQLASGLRYEGQWREDKACGWGAAAARL